MYVLTTNHDFWKVKKLGLIIILVGKNVFNYKFKFCVLGAEGLDTRMIYSYSN